MREGASRGAVRAAGSHDKVGAHDSQKLRGREVGRHPLPHRAGKGTARAARSAHAALLSVGFCGFCRRAGMTAAVASLASPACFAMKWCACPPGASPSWCACSESTDCASYVAPAAGWWSASQNAMLAAAAIGRDRRHQQPDQQRSHPQSHRHTLPQPPCHDAPPDLPAARQTLGSWAHWRHQCPMSEVALSPTCSSVPTERMFCARSPLGPCTSS